MDVEPILHSAVRYVEGRGEAFDTARARLLAYAIGAAGVIDAYASRQSSRGAIAPGAETRGSVAFLESAGVESTVSALWELLELGLLGAPIVEDAVAYLHNAQAEDGSWGSGDDVDSRVRTTGMVGGVLARTRWGRPALVQAAGDFLAEHWSPDRVKGGRWTDIAAHANYFANVDHEQSDPVLQWCGRELERGYVSNRWGPVASARVMLLCGAHALPGAKSDGPDLAVGILNTQTADGCWLDATDAVRGATSTTLSALAALIHFGVRPIASPVAPGANHR